MEVYTIGFTRKAASDFFGRLKSAGIRRLVDVRLHNSSQLAGFAKKEDLSYFLKELCGADYVHEPLMAPTPEILSAYRKREISWEEYERQFLALMAERKIEERLDRALFDGGAVLLCSEDEADHCHRRLVLEYLGARWRDIEIVHL